VRKEAVIYLRGLGFFFLMIIMKIFNYILLISQCVASISCLLAMKKHLVELIFAHQSWN